MGVTSQHLHGLVPGNSSDFLVTEARFHQTGDCFVAQVMKTQTLDTGFLDVVDCIKARLFAAALK